MITLETTYPYQDSIRGIRELLHEAARLALRWTALLMRRPGTAGPTAGSRPAQATRPRWTREVENPFDIPARACDEAIR